MLADRYIYTAFARDVARGCDPAWVREVYKFAVKPTIAFFFRAPLDVAIDRIVSARPSLKYYEAGLDMGWSDNPEESFTLFQGRILGEYDRMVSEFGLTQIDATRSIEQQQRKFGNSLESYRKQAVQIPLANNYFGATTAYSGGEWQLIVIEGPMEKVTHICFCAPAGISRPRGCDTGMTRSVLAGGIKEGKPVTPSDV